jgi:hypothetical protein
MNDPADNPPMIDARFPARVTPTVSRSQDLPQREFGCGLCVDDLERAGKVGTAAI